MTDLQQAASETGPLVRVRMLLAYDGTPFHGFAVQPNARSVAGDIQAALTKIFGSEPILTCAGRTDAGVHAWGQVVHFDVPASRMGPGKTARLQNSLNKMCAPEIVIRQVDLVDDSFDARYSATGRLYHYVILNTPLPNPFVRERTWWVTEALDVEAMNEASTAFIGEHDFTSFCRQRDDFSSLTRNVRKAEWIHGEPGMLRFEIEANAFCHQMVRSLTGMLVAIGAGRRAIGDMKQVLEERSRVNAAPLAPPQGLTLQRVFY